VIVFNCLTLSPPAVKTQWLSQCQAFQRLVRSSQYSSQLNFWSTESIFNQFSVFLKTLNVLCVCLQYKHPRSIKRVIRSDKPVTLLLLLWSHKCNFGTEPRSRIIATSAVKGLICCCFFSLQMLLLLIIFTIIMYFTKLFLLLYSPLVQTHCRLTYFYPGPLQHSTHFMGFF
jgi:hypothetical protein